MPSWCLAEKIKDWPKPTSKTWTEPCKNYSISDLWQIYGPKIHNVKTLTTKDSKGPQTNMPRNVGSIKTWSAKMTSRHIKLCKQNTAMLIVLREHFRISKQIYLQTKFGFRSQTWFLILFHYVHVQSKSVSSQMQHLQHNFKVNHPFKTLDYVKIFEFQNGSYRSLSLNHLKVDVCN